MALDVLRNKNAVAYVIFIHLFMCVDVHISFGTLTLAYFCVSSVFNPVPNFTKQNPLVYRSLPVLSLEIELVN